MSPSNIMFLPASRNGEARTSNHAGAPDSARSRTTTTVTAASRPPTVASAGRLAEAEYISAAQYASADAEQEYMDDDDEFYDDHDEERRMSESRWVDVYAPLTQAIASLAAAKANEQVALALPPLRGIHLIALDIRQAQAIIDLARVAGNASLVQVEQSLLAAFQVELSTTLARVRR
jgi:hypothetical protein